MAKTSFFTDTGPTPSVLTTLESSVNAAAASEANAATSETNAAASAVSALASKNSASSDAATATTKASEASTSATSAATSLSNIGSSETNAATSATNAANSATAAAGSATTASGHATTATTQASTATTKASEASTSATNAATSATTASTQASTATTKASEAATSATNAASSATTASTGASTATTQATNAATSASTASTQATNASNSATAAATSATNAATSATASETAKTASVAAKDAALAALDSFDDRYLGTKSSDPSVDNDNDALVSGALYYNTSTNVMKVYSGSSWLAAYASLSGTLLASNNLSDLANAATARTNLGVVDATDSAKGIASFSATDFSVSSGAVSLNSESVQDIVGAMLTGNSETGITVAYQDADGTIDFTVGDVTLGSGTSGNYVATISDAGSSRITVANSGAESAAVTLDIADNAINVAKLAVSEGSAGQVLTTNGSGTLSFSSVGGAYNDWAVKTTTYTAVNKDQLIANHASTAFTITLPSSPSAGNTVIIKNVGNALVTIGRNSSNIDSVAADGTLPKGNAVQLVYVDSTIGWASL